MIRQVITFIIAGHETTAGVVSFTLWFLATNPDVAAKARAEVDAMWSAPGQDSPDVAFEQVPKLRYLRRVIDESMRLWPTVPGYFRRARTDTTLGGQYDFEAREWALVVVLAMIAIHEMLMALALLVHRYEFDVEPGYELKVKKQLTLRPDSFRMSVRKRPAL